MGFVLLGLMAANGYGLSGAVLQMFSHGIIAGLLFAIVGRMVYDRTHTRELDTLEGLNLAKTIPFAAVTFTIAIAASMGIPGFSGFVAEIQVLVGSWQVFPTLTVVAGVGILIGIAFSLRALQKAFFPTAEDAPVEPGVAAHLPPITLPEKAGALLLIISTLAVGLYPDLLLNLIKPSCGQ